MKLNVLTVSNEMVPTLSSPFDFVTDMHEHALHVFASSEEGTGIMWINQEGEKIEIGAFSQEYLEDELEKDEEDDDLGIDSAMLANQLP